MSKGYSLLFSEDYISNKLLYINELDDFCKVNFSIGSSADNIFLN
jgi:hypothetical protein